LSANGLQGEKETAVFHDRNFVVGTNRRTMNFQRTANCVLTVCLSRGGRRNPVAAVIRLCDHGVPRMRLRAFSVSSNARRTAAQYAPALSLTRTLGLRRAKRSGLPLEGRFLMVLQTLEYETKVLSDKLFDPFSPAKI
jgi:hypothetical protein